MRFPMGKVLQVTGGIILLSGLITAGPTLLREARGFYNSPRFDSPSAVQHLDALVVAGKTCKVEGSLGSLTCFYTVGRDLEFAVAGVGEMDAGVSFTHSVFEGDYYASFGIQHGCVIVKRGPKTLRIENAFDFAFVSPTNGKVYRDWRECQKGE